MGNENERFDNKIVIESMSREIANSGIRITVEEFNVSAKATAELQERMTELGSARQAKGLAKMKKEKID